MARGSGRWPVEGVAREAGVGREVEAEPLGEDGEELLGGGEARAIGAAASVALGELAVEEGEAAAVGEGARDGEASLEVRCGVGAGVPVGDDAIDGRHLLEGELVHVVPLVVELDLVEQEVVLADEAAGLVRGGLRGGVGEAEGGGEGHAADADVGEVGLIELDADEEVGARGHEVARALEPNACAEGVGLESELGEDGEEQGVLLEAVAAAAVVDELALEGGELEVDGAAEEDVEVLERDGLDVRGHDRVQGVEGRRARPVIADAREVGIEIDHGITMAPAASGVEDRAPRSMAIQRVRWRGS